MAKKILSIEIMKCTKRKIGESIERISGVSRNHQAISIKSKISGNNKAKISICERRRNSEII